VEGLGGTSERLARLVSFPLCPLGGGASDRGCLLTIGPDRSRQVELEVDIEPEGVRQLERAAEESGSGRPVSPPERSPTGGGEALARTLGELRSRLSELLPVVSRLLEVVAEDLVQLDQVPAPLFEPTGEALV
jgi:hypothetical protein